MVIEHRHKALHVGQISALMGMGGTCARPKVIEGQYAGAIVA